MSGAPARSFARAYPDLPLTLSCEVAPEIREYERTSTACANAYVQPLMRRYLDRLETRLTAIGFAGRLYVMLSGGGIAAVQEAKDFPIRMIESGPAAGAMAASFLARLAGLDRVVSFDMGGTTAKMCLVENGAPDHKFDFEAGRVRRFVKGSGLPLKVSVVDMIEIGAGGGSIARVEPSSGLMKVGPRSAGAKPGPVCYGLGGTEPTVTDADLVLGRLNPDYFLGGEMQLDLDGVRRAFADGVAPRAEDSGDGLRARRPAHRRRDHGGRDPDASCREGPRPAPLHADRLRRRRTGARLQSRAPAQDEARWSCRSAPASRPRSASWSRRRRPTWCAATWRGSSGWTGITVNALFAEMTEEGSRLLSEAGADPSTIALRPTADMRHVGQGFEIPVPLPLTRLGPEDLPAIREAFFASYRERFGRVVEDSPIEAMSWRLACVAPGQDIRIRPTAVDGGTAVSAACRGTREVLFEGLGSLPCAVYDRYALAPGAMFDGPALVEERESTCCIGPDARVSVDQFLNLVIDLA